MIDLKTVKLVVWDLDDTFWQGTFSEGVVHLPESHKKLVEDLTDCGIINSICSKNDFETTKDNLKSLGIWDIFVFPSINWESKGPQLKEKIEKMALRPENVLFLDDNDSNLGEAKHFLPTVQVGGPGVIQELIDQVSSFDKKDIQHKRLKQYKLLEEKDFASKAYLSNEDFLFDSCIQVSILHDCISHIQRIHELLLRSNQLNYTKKRISIDELKVILENKDYDCGYVTVKDRFGDYGLVGFYAKNQERLEHFLFSCRTMGQKIEQWVYAQLGFPELEIVGEVRTILSKTECPKWINHKSIKEQTSQNSIEKNSSCSILLKGPCDLSHSQVYLKDSVSIDSEFTYVDGNGRIIDAHNHSVHILGLKSYTEEEKKILVKDCVFIDPAMLTGSFFSKEYDVIILSTLIESTYQIYQKKGTHLRVVFGGVDMTNPDNWDGYITGKFYNGCNDFSREYLAGFAEKYECVGQTTPEMYVQFLSSCLDGLPTHTCLCLILGATKGLDGIASEEDAKRKHSRLNHAIRCFSRSNPRIRYIELDDCIHGDHDFDGGINHFSARVYYELAQKIIEIVRQETGHELKTYSKKIVLFDRLVLSIRPWIKRVLGSNAFIYRLAKSFYNKIYKNR